MCFANTESIGSEAFLGFLGVCIEFGHIFQQFRFFGCKKFNSRWFEPVNPPQFVYDSSSFLIILIA